MLQKVIFLLLIVLIALFFLIDNKYPFIISEHANIYCYQETANVSSTCGSIITSNQGNYVFYVNPENPITGIVFINYSKLDKSVGADWQVRIGDLAIQNISLPQACWDNYPNVLALRLRGVVDISNIHSSYAECFYDSQWHILLENIASDTGGVVNWYLGDFSNVYDKNYTTGIRYGGEPGGWRSGNEKGVVGNARYNILWEEAIIWNITLD